MTVTTMVPTRAALNSREITLSGSGKTKDKEFHTAHHSYLICDIFEYVDCFCFIHLTRVNLLLTNK